MWYAPKISIAPSSEPVTLDEAKRQLRATDFDDDDAYINGLISAVRDHAEKYCGVFFASQTAEMECTSWEDLGDLPVNPVTSVTSISYVDAQGSTQTLADTVYELRGDAIVLKYGQNWPALQDRSVITVTAVVGYDVAPPAVKQAMLLRIDDFYENRETAEDSNWSAFDSLLANYRYY